jgi:hypothetical protein
LEVLKPQSFLSSHLAFTSPIIQNISKNAMLKKNAVVTSKNVLLPIFSNQIHLLDDTEVTLLTFTVLRNDKNKRI